MLRIVRYCLDDSEAVLDDILRSGKQIFAIATDDNHNPGGSFIDSFGGFTMIKAPELSYGAVIGALERGEIYSSTGPLIEELYYEDGYVHIKTSEAADICMTTLGRNGGRAVNDDGSPITGASFRIDPDYGFVRFRVRDMKGNKAWTNAYYVDEFHPGARHVRAII